MNTIRVLLADDHAIVRAGIRNVVQDIPGLQVAAEAGNGPQVFEALTQAQFDCLLIDVTMPDFEPISAIRQIRHLYPDLKILVVSAYDDETYVQGLLAAGVNGYHLKDQPLRDLQLAVQRVMAGERWLSAPLVDRLLRGPATTAAPQTTERQRELLRLLRQGLDNQAIAQRMGLSVKTVENHLTRLYRQLNVQSRLEAVNYSLQHPEVLGVLAGSLSNPPVENTTALQQSVSILVVDDNPRYRRQLQHMIGKVCPAATIYEAEDIASAVHLSQRLNPQLVLVDVVLGDEDGIRCTRRVKAISPQSRIVLISAYPDREFHRLGLEAGAVAFLDKKDLDAATLRHVIDDLVS